MIADNSSISLSDWRERAAIEVYPGAELASPMSKPTRVADRTVTTSRNAICLLLSNGKTLSGSGDQKIRRWGTYGGFIRMKDIEMGQKLMGNVEGVQTVVHVTGIMWLDEEDVRLVELDTHEGRPYIAGGVVCR